VQALLEPYAAASAGTFGRVLECWDRKHRSYVAIKIVRNVKKYRDAAMIEVSLASLFDSLSAHFVCSCSFLVPVWSSLALLVSLLSIVKHCKHLQQLQTLASLLVKHTSRLLAHALALPLSHLDLHVLLFYTSAPIARLLSITHSVSCSCMFLMLTWATPPSGAALTTVVRCAVGGAEHTGEE